MPFIASTSKIDFPSHIKQEEVKDYAKKLFAPHVEQIDRLLPVFDNTEISNRNFCLPINEYEKLGRFEEHNNEYIHTAVTKSIEAINECLKKANVHKDDVTDIIFISTTGLATPSIDALIANQLRLNQHINRIPVFGLGCAGGVSGVAKANTLAIANPQAIVLLVAVELCSLTFLRNDFSKSNFVASSLFSDGIAACLVMGDYYKNENTSYINIVAAESKLYYDSLDVMGWEFVDNGFKVIFSQNIPAIISQNVKNDVEEFLAKHNLALKDIKNFIFHPGGRKVLAAYEDALHIDRNCLKHTREVMRDYGNMSSATVLYVLDRFLNEGFEDGYGLMLALGPGFSNEAVLLSMHHN